MGKLGVVALVLLLSAAGAAYVFRDKIEAVVSPLRDTKMLTACEATLADRLKAPATYRRVEVREIIEPTTADEAANASAPELPGPKPTKAEKARTDQAIASLRQLYSENDPHRYRLLIVYDAANAYGTPIRGVAECVYYYQSKVPISDLPLYDGDVRIDGLNKLEWSLSRVLEMLPK